MKPADTLNSPSPSPSTLGRPDGWHLSEQCPLWVRSRRSRGSRQGISAVGPPRRGGCKRRPRLPSLTATRECPSIHRTRRRFPLPHRFRAFRIPGELGTRPTFMHLDTGRPAGAMLFVTRNISRQPYRRSERQLAKEQGVITTNSPLPVVGLLDAVDDHVRRLNDEVVALLRRCRLTFRCRQSPDV